MLEHAKAFNVNQFRLCHFSYCAMSVYLTRFESLFRNNGQRIKKFASQTQAEEAEEKGHMKSVIKILLYVQVYCD